MLASWLLLWTATAQARCPEPGEVRLSLLYPLDTAAASAVSGASFHRDAVLGLTLGPGQQVLRGQAGRCDWTFSAEVRSDLLGSRAVSPVLGAARSRTLGPARVTAEGLVGTEGRAPLVSARLRLSRSAIRLVPYLLAEGTQVLSLQEGWRVSTEAGLGYGIRDQVGIALAGTAAVVPEVAWGGQVSLFFRPR